MSRGSGGMGKKMDSQKEAEARTRTAHGLLANPSSQADNACSNSSNGTAGAALRAHLEFVGAPPDSSPGKAPGTPGACGPGETPGYDSALEVQDVEGLPSTLTEGGGRPAKALISASVPLMARWASSTSRASNATV